MISTAANLIGFSVTFLFLNTLVVGLRLLSRRISAARLWWDDAFIVISLVGEPYERDISISKFTTDPILWLIHLHFHWYYPSAHHGMLTR